MAGNYSESLNQGIDDPLHARAMFLSEGDVSAIVVTLDLCSIGRVVSDPIRKSVQKATRVPFKNIIVSATHNHAGPEYYGTLRDLLHEQAIEKHGGKDPAESMDYIGFLIDQVTRACEDAVAGATASNVRVGETEVHGIAFNRRFHMRDGSVQMNPGFDNPDRLRVAGPVDPRLPLAWFESAGEEVPSDEVPSGKVPSDEASSGKASREGVRGLGLYTTFAMHTATYGDLTRYGADFPGVLDRRLRDSFGDWFVTLFGEGTAGDINHIDYAGERRPDRWKDFERIGNRLADAVVKVEPELTRIDQPRMRCAQTIIPVPLAELNAWSRDEAADVIFAPKGAHAFLERVDAWKQINTRTLRERDGDQLQVEIQAIALGDQFAILSMPHEVFVELGMRIRDQSPFPITCVVTLAQDIDFYVPTRKAFAEGSYEVTTSSIQPGGGETITEGAIELLRRVSRQP